VFQIGGACRLALDYKYEKNVGWGHQHRIKRPRRTVICTSDHKSHVDIIIIIIIIIIVVVVVVVVLLSMHLLATAHH
jgi:t-SNARE complex subunit (syntaxin)